MKLTSEQQDLRDTFARFADRELAPDAGKRDRQGLFPYDLVPRLAESGVFAIPFPEEAGGQGGGAVDFCLALIEISRADQSLGALVANQVGLSAMPIYRFGTPEQKDRWLPRLFEGSVLGSFGLTEPGGGSDTVGMRTLATRVDGGWVLDGAKTFITNAGTDITGFTIVAAVSGQRPAGRPETTSFIVPTDTEGFRVGPPLEKLGWRSSDTREVFLDRCFVPDDAVLGTVGVGLRQFLSALAFGRIQIASLGVGLVEAALECGTRYARERTAFGRTIGEFQGVSFKLADMAVDASAARLLTLEAAELYDDGLASDDAAGRAKLFASEAANRASNACLQIHGGAGFMDDSTPARLYRDCKVLEIGEGTSEIQRMLIARALLAT